MSVETVMVYTVRCICIKNVSKSFIIVSNFGTATMWVWHIKEESNMISIK
jgi:hypothetical protein